MFIIFDNIHEKPLIVKISSDRQRKGDIARKAIMLFSSHEAGVAALKKIFGSDEKWNLSRFSVRENKGEAIPAFCELRARTGVDTFCDGDGKILSEKEIWPFLGIKDEKDTANNP